MLDELRVEIERERNGLRDRYEKLAADAAFSYQAMENDGVEASMSSKIDDMTDTMIRYSGRIQALDRQIGFVIGLRGQVEGFFRGDAGEAAPSSAVRPGPV